MTDLGFQAVIFDLDATLVNLGQFVEWNTAKTKIIEKYLLLGCKEDTVESCSAKGLFTMLNLMWDNLCIESSEALEIQSKIFEILEIHELEGVQSCILLRGARDALDWLKERDIPMGLCTSNSQKVAEAILDQLNLSDFFSSVVGRAPGIKLKPDPEQLIKVFRQLHVDPRRGIMVGDSPGDVLAAKSIGTYTIGIPAYYRKPESLLKVGVDELLESLMELPSVFQKLFR